jgi:hypothetical protein
MLGLALDESVILAAEVGLRRGQLQVRRAAELPVAEADRLQAPESLGEVVRRFLREHRFGARRVVVGFPTRWLMSREVTVPPAATDAMAAMLRIRAEGEFSTALDELDVDCANDPSPQGGNVLLVATLRRRREEVLRMAGAAKLRVQAITATDVVLAAASDSAKAGLGLMLRLTPASAEFAVTADGRCRMLRHVPFAGDGQPEAKGSRVLGTVSDEARRALSLLSGGPTVEGGGGVTLWDGIGLEAPDRQALRDKLALPGTDGANLASLGVVVSEPLDELQQRRLAPAVALAAAGLRPSSRGVNFLHSRLGLVQRKVLGRRAIWAACIGAALGLAGVAFLWTMWSETRDVSALRDKKNRMQADVDQAQRVVKRVSAAAGWYDRRPPLLECLRRLTLAFPEEGRIWTTNLTLKDNLQGVLSGEAVDSKSVLDLLDRLKASGVLPDIKVLYMREKGGSSRDVLFAINFSFSAGELGR